MDRSPTFPLVARLRPWQQVVGFGVVQLTRMRGLLEWMRQQPVAGGNIVEEVLNLGNAASTGARYDAQRVYELLGVRTGDGVGSCYLDGEVKILARTIDLVVRSVARHDQAAHCAARCGDLMLELHRFCFADPEGAVRAEAAHHLRLVEAIAALGGSATFRWEALDRVPEYARGPLGPRAAANVGRAYRQSFGPAADSFADPVWQDPFDDSSLQDGRDPVSTRKAHVDGW